RADHVLFPIQGRLPRPVPVRGPREGVPADHSRHPRCSPKGAEAALASKLSPSRTRSAQFDADGAVIGALDLGEDPGLLHPGTQARVDVGVVDAPADVALTRPA